MTEILDVLFIEQNKLRPSSARALIAYLWECAELRRKFKFFLEGGFWKPWRFLYSKRRLSAIFERLSAIFGR